MATIGPFVDRDLFFARRRVRPRMLAIIAAILLAGVTTVLPADEPPDLSAQEQAYETAMEAKDYQAAERTVREQLRDKPEDPDLLYKLAWVLWKQNPKDAKSVLNGEPAKTMRELLEKHQHLRAGWWLMRALSDKGRRPRNGTEQHQEYGRILHILSENHPEHFYIQDELATFYMFSGQLEKAIPILDKLSVLQPMKGLTSATLLRNLQREDEANQRAEKALELVEKLYVKDPQSTPLAMEVAMCNVFLRDYEETASVLETAIERASNETDITRLNVAITANYVAWINRIRENEDPDQGPTNNALVFKLLESSLIHAPENTQVLSLFTKQALEMKDDDSPEFVKARKTFLEYAPPRYKHFYLGSTRLASGDNEGAVEELRKAVELWPTNAATLNNLAIAIAAHGDADSLTEALALSDKAFKLIGVPTAQFHETRGQILYRLKRYQEAIGELELSLKMPSLRAKACRSLAVCYEQLGDEKMADEFREAANSTDE